MKNMSYLLTNGELPQIPASKQATITASTSYDISASLFINNHYINSCNKFTNIIHAVHNAYIHDLRTHSYAYIAKQITQDNMTYIVTYGIYTTK